MPPTLDTIARSTGFSKCTVSRVLGGKAGASRISEETARKIKAEAERCGYTTNFVAKKMRSQKSRTIGLVVPHISNPYFADIASVIIGEVQKNGYTTIVADSMEDEKLQNSAVASMLAAKVAGIIVAPCGSDSSFLEQVGEGYTPVVLVDRYYEGSLLPYVVTNNFKGGYDATMALVKNGHKRIACIQGSVETTPNKKRVEGYLRAMRDAGLEGNTIVVGNEFSVENGCLEATLLVRDKDRMPTAIFALSNNIGLGALKAIKEAGLGVPEDISLISFDNNTFLDYITPSISRIGQRIDEMGKMAVKILVECIKVQSPVKSQIELSPVMIARESIVPLLGTA